MHLGLALFLVSIVAAHGKETLEKDMGQIYFYDQVQTLNYDLNLNFYYSNVEAFSNVTRELTLMCEGLPSINTCKEHVSGYEQDLILMEKNIEFVQTHKRPKRVAPLLAAVGGVARTVAISAATGALVAHVVNMYHDNSNQGENNKYNEILEQNLNNTRIQLLNDERDHFDEQMMNIQYKKYEDLLHTASVLANRHFRDTNMYIRILKEDIKLHFFSVIGLDEFEEQLTQLGSTLPKNYSWPSIDATDVIELSDISVEHNATNIKIIVDIPLINTNSNFTLHELIPIPFMFLNQTRIVNSNSFYYIQTFDQIKILSHDDFDKCSKLENFTLCELTLYTTLNQPDACMSALIGGRKPNNCTYKYIEQHTYIMQLSSHSVYCYVIEPIILKTTCQNDNYIYNLTESKELIYDENCRVFQISDFSANDFTKRITYNIEYVYVMPNLSIYDQSLKNWTYNFTEINRRRIESLGIIKGTGVLIDSLHELKKEPEQSFFGSAWESMKNFVTNLLSDWIFMFILKYVLIPFAILQFLMCFCYRLKRK